jgi:hypothetical protein
MSGSTTSQRLAGVTSVNIDGTAYNITECTYRVGMVKRETIASLNSGAAGYKELLQGGHIKLTVLDSAGFAMGFFSGLTNSTVVINAANGKSISGSGLWVLEAVEVNAAEGRGEVTFEGPPLTETGIAR